MHDPKGNGIMLIVADSSALVALAMCDCLHVLEELFGEVRVPKAVYAEVCKEGKPCADILAKWLENRVYPVRYNPLLFTGAGLGNGEIEAMTLCLEMAASFLLVDDKRARKVALLNNIEIMGTLGVLLMAKQQGLIVHIKPLIQQLQDSSLHISPKLFQVVLEKAGE